LRLCSCGATSSSLLALRGAKKEGVFPPQPPSLRLLLFFAFYLERQFYVDLAVAAYDRL